MLFGLTIAIVCMFVGMLILIHGAQTWNTIDELISYTGIGLGVLIIPMKIFLSKTNR